MPLFVEELTTAVLETNNRVLAASALTNLAIPPTLHASLIARLDRLGPIAKHCFGQVTARVRYRANKSTLGVALAIAPIA